MVEGLKTVQYSNSTARQAGAETVNKTWSSKKWTTLSYHWTKLDPASKNTSWCFLMPWWPRYSNEQKNNGWPQTGKKMFSWFVWKKSKLGRNFKIWPFLKNDVSVEPLDQCNPIKNYQQRWRVNLLYFAAVTWPSAALRCKFMPSCSKLIQWNLSSHFKQIF